MLIKGIDFPEQLLQAQAAGELVVFAGAGISNPAPSSLPLFAELAKLVGKGSGLEKDAGDPDDRYLGRLKKRDINVHQAAADVLLNTESNPHELHTLLVKLFGSPKAVRLVTTNFDRHFSTILRQTYGDQVETFFAPALPIGDDFSGLVYLHGAAGKSPDRCILTDEDFGRAYLTQAWASRFLATMFSKYVVMFVGYSHNDTVMNYLARGLPPVTQKQRFAFTTDDPESLTKWEFLGIRPLSYKKAVIQSNPHQPITDSVREWVKDIGSGLLEKAQRIRAIAEVQPPLEGEDSDYIKHSLVHLDTARIFFKHARIPEWISWLEKNQFIQPVFDPRKELSQFHWELSAWLVETFLPNHSQALMAILERHGGNLNPKLCWWIWRRLSSRNREAVPQNVFSQWGAILLSQPLSVLPVINWGSLLNECSIPSDKTIAVLLLEKMTKPHVVLKKGWDFVDESHVEQKRVEFNINIFQDGADGEHFLTEAWNNVFKPNLAQCSTELEAIVVSNLAAAHKLLTLTKPLSAIHDPFYYHRQSIEPHEQNHYRNSVDVLIDAGRDVLDHLLSDDPPQAAARIHQWFHSDIPILRRIAVSGFAKRRDVSNDDKLRWIQQNHLIYDFKTDVFWLLRNAFPGATESVRKEFLDAAASGPDLQGDDLHTKETKQYEIFNLVAWLYRLKPDSEVTKEFFQRLREKHPTFKKREFPELAMWSSDVDEADPTSGIDVNDLPNRSPETLLDELQAWVPHHPLDRTRENYCNAIAMAVTKRPSWGKEWLETLRSRQITDSDLWSCVCRGWRSASLNSEQWAEILDVAETIDAPSEFFNSFADTLENGASREANPIPNEHMGKARRVAVRIWDLVLAKSKIEENSFGDWLTTALNRPAGRLAEFWLQSISRLRAQAGDTWTGLPAEIGTELARMVQSQSGAAAHARTILASRIHYLFSIDPTFADAHLIPMFDWKSDELRAEQCWSGFIYWGRWLPGFVDRLLPSFDETVKRIAKFDSNMRNHLLNHVAGVSLFLLDDPLKEDWLFNIVSTLSDDDRIHLAEAFDRSLRATETTVAERIFERWLRIYWKRRILNIPKPLLANEANYMAGWSVNFGQYFPVAVELAAQMKNLLTFKHTPVFYLLDEIKKGLVPSYPNDTADLVLLYLEAPLDFFDANKHVKNVWVQLSNSGIDQGKLHKIREALFRWGSDPGQP